MEKIYKAELTVKVESDEDILGFEIESDIKQKSQDIIEGTLRVVKVLPELITKFWGCVVNKNPAAENGFEAKLILEWSIEESGKIFVRISAAEQRPLDAFLEGCCHVILTDDPLLYEILNSGTDDETGKADDITEAVQCFDPNC